MERTLLRMILGTAQLGMHYGITNNNGVPDTNLSQSILKTAAANGICRIDTARAYGNSEETIGAFLKSQDIKSEVLTKLSPLDELSIQSSVFEINASVDASVFQSCAALGVSCLDVLSLHRANHLSAWDGAVIKRLRELRDDGVILQIGVSVQNPIEAEEALAISDIGVIQFPFNVLDWRWNNLIPKMIGERLNRGLQLHARSALLQGLLTSDEEYLWNRAHVSQPQPIIEWLRCHSAYCGRLNTKDLCLNYVNSQNWIDGVVIGVETLQQLEENIEFFDRPLLSQEELQSIISSRPKVAQETLNPASWRKA
jgi:aryl-alcohol dehydrogenase-like predicted oxidoreductase